MMRTFSRWMPSGRPTLSIPALLVLAALGVGAIWLVITHPWILVGILGVALISDILDRRRRARLRQMGAQRVGEGLCTFVRAFPRTQREPWVLRAIYNELQPYYTVGRLVVPPRPSDQLHYELEIDPEDLEYIALVAAKRAGRDSRAWHGNPFQERPHTVADLVALVSAQPRVAA